MFAGYRDFKAQRTGCVLVSDELLTAVSLSDPARGFYAKTANSLGNTLPAAEDIDAILMTLLDNSTTH